MIEFVAETGSTNADLSARLASGQPVAEGNWLVVDRQLAGRGRLGREWFDGSGNFMGSTVVQLGTGEPHAGSLALVAGLAVHEAVSEILPAPHRAELKWPNDLMIGMAKLAGILLERVGTAVVVGIGVNLARAPVVDGRATIALAELTAPPSRDAFAASLAAHFERELHRWRAYGLEPILSRWQAAAHPVGTSLRVGPGEAMLVGEFGGLTDDGALQLRLPGGTTQVIHAGDVFLAAER